MSTFPVETKEKRQSIDKGIRSVVAYLIAGHQIVQGLDCVLHLALP